LRLRPTGLLLVLAVGVMGVLLCAGEGRAEEIKANIQEALDRGDTAQAVTYLQREISEDPSYHVNYYVLGRIHFAQRRWQAALEQFDLALDKKSKHWMSLYYKGLCQLQLEDIEGAGKSMERGRKKAKKEAYWFENGTGMVLLAEHKYDEAVAAFMRAQRGDTANAEFHINLGDAYFYQGVPSLAATEYERAHNLDTASTEVYFHWAEACLEMKDYTCSIEKLRIVLSKDSTYALAWSRAGEIYFKAALSARGRADREARFKDVIGSYKRYLELSGVQPDSSSVRAYFELALSYANLNGFEDAAEYFDKVLSIPFEPRDIYFHYGKSLWGVRDFDKAAVMLKKHLEWAAAQNDDYHSSISESEVYQLLGDSYYYRKPNDFYNAAEWYRKSLEIDPNQRRITQNMAVALHRLKNYVEALSYYDRRIEMGVDSAGSGIYRFAGYCALAIASGGAIDEEMDEGIDEEEEEPVVTATTMQPDPNVNYNQLAIAYLEKYLEFNPNDDKVLLSVASTYFADLGDCARGVEYFERVLSIDPSNCDAQRSLGYAYFGGACPGLKNYGRALRYLTGAYDCITKDGDACKDVDVALWIAQCYHLRAVEGKSDDKSSDYKNANAWYHKVLKCEPANKDAKEGADNTSFEF